MIRVNTQVADTASDGQREMAQEIANGNGNAEAREPGEFDTRSFTIPDRELDPNGNARMGLGKRIMKTFDWTVTKIAAALYDGIQFFNKYR
ncbi:MAG: hypothetical protein R3324_07585, partial [Halobacteriales archaeon]|nr:hypothetical protein [Halobacteriales archaeon]